MTKKEDVDWEGYIITSKQWADGQYISLETLYQAFKERAANEASLIVKDRVFLK